MQALVKELKDRAEKIKLGKQKSRFNMNELLTG